MFFGRQIYLFPSDSKTLKSLAKLILIPTRILIQKPFLKKTPGGGQEKNPEVCINVLCPYDLVE